MPPLSGDNSAGFRSPAGRLANAVGNNPSLERFQIDPNEKSWLNRENANVDS